MAQPQTKSRVSVGRQYTAIMITRRTYQVVSQQLHDQCGILVALLTESVELSNSIIEGLLGKMACLVRCVEDLIVEDRKVEGKTKTDWMSGCEVSLGDFGGGFVGLKRFVCRLLAFVGSSELGKVSVVVTLPKSRIRES